jgi:glutamyl-tRNA synthetase
MGLRWDEGPDMGGQYGPYRQSERFDIYREYTEKLIERGAAYHCYCTKEELEASRKDDDGNTASFTYDGRCRHLTAEQKKKYEDEGRRPTVRFHVPENQTLVIRDHVKGEVTFDTGNIGGDFIIVRSDGVPIYNYIVIIDDALMKVTHVVRGEDHLSNTPKQVLVAMALDLPVPEYAHMPLILGPDRSKLSKRHGITSVDLYRKEGYLPQALMNYLALLGWTTDTGEEIMTQEELIAQFDLSRISKSATIFDFQKLKWMNGQYLRKLPVEELKKEFAPYIRDAGYDISTVEGGRFTDIIELLKNYCEILSDIGRFLGIFLDETPSPDEEARAMLKEDYAKDVIRAACRALESGLTEANFSTELISMIKANTEQKGKKLFMPVRAIVTGRLKGPELDMALPLIGFENVKRRIRFCYENYGK